MSPNASPHDVRLAWKDLGAIVEGGPPIGGPGHLPHPGMARDALHAQAGAKLAALQIDDKSGNRPAKGPPLASGQRPQVTLSFVCEVIRRHG